MFYNPLELTQEQKLVYVRLLIYLAKSDKNFAKIEQSFIQKLMIRFDLPPSALNGLSVPSDLDEIYDILKPINTRALALDLIHCLWFATSVDEIIADEEVAIIRKVARYLHIDEDTLLRINSFVLDEMALVERAQKIMETNNLRYD